MVASSSFGRSIASEVGVAAHDDRQELLSPTLDVGVDLRVDVRRSDR